MSSITGSRHNCEQGQPKPQRGGGAQPTTTTKPQGGRGRASPQAPPHRGAGRIPRGGGERGCGSPASYIYIYIHIYIHIYIYIYIRV